MPDRRTVTTTIAVLFSLALVAVGAWRECSPRRVPSFAPPEAR